MISKKKADKALKVLCREFGVPYDITFDIFKEQCKKGTTFMKEVRNHDIKYRISKPNMHNKNPAEGVIREIRRKMVQENG